MKTKIQKLQKEADTLYQKIGMFKNPKCLSCGKKIGGTGKTGKCSICCKFGNKSKTGIPQTNQNSLKNLLSEKSNIYRFKNGMVKEKCVNWKGGKKSLICKNCNKEYQEYDYRKSKFCSIKCSSENRLKNRKKRPRLKNGQALKKNLWTIFSKYIRQRDGGICISCGKVDDWKNTDAGHYIPRTAGLSLYFDEKNVNCQCTRCNRWMHGNLSSYAIALRKKYGENILEELDEKRKISIQISTLEYQKLIEKYKKLCQ